MWRVARATISTLSPTRARTSPPSYACAPPTHFATALVRTVASSSTPDPLDALWFKEGFEFKCTACGRCCAGGDHATFVNTQEVIELAAAKDIELEELGERYLRVVQGRPALRLNADGTACVFLDNNRKCSVYDARPTQCRTYPFWRENMLTPHDWEAEGARCEGVAAGRDAVAVGSTAQQAEATVSAPSAIALSMFEEIHRGGVEDMTMATMQTLLAGVAAEHGSVLTEFTEEVFLRYRQRVVFQDPELLVIDTEDMSPCAAHDVAATLVASEPKEDEQEAEELPPRAYRTSPTAIVRAMVLRSSPQLVQTAAAVYADGTAHTKTLLLEPHVALTVGLAWRQLLPSPLANEAQPTEPSESPVVAVLGVGGGALPLTLHAQFPSMTVDAVELSSGVAAAAQAHFGLTPDERLTLHVGDGAAFVEGAPAGRYDVVMVDVAGSRGYSDEAVGTLQTEGATGSTLLVPPAAFLSDTFVGGVVKRAMRRSGVLAVNVIADSPAGIARLKVRLLAHYATVCTVSAGSMFTVFLASDMAGSVSEAAMRHAVAAHPTWCTLLGDWIKLQWTCDTSTRL